MIHKGQGDPHMLDLDKERKARFRRSKKNATEPIIFGGEVIAEVSTELPLHALMPLLDLVELDLPLILRTGMDTLKTEGKTEADAVIDMVDMAINLFFQNRDLPQKLVEAVSEIGRRILGREGFDQFFEQQPSLPDVIALVRGLARMYGVGLGEFKLSSTTSAESGGTTSELISSTGTTSTFEESGMTPVTPVSSGSETSVSSPSGSPAPL